MREGDTCVRSSAAERPSPKRVCEGSSPSGRASSAGHLWCLRPEAAVTTASSSMAPRCDGLALGLSVGVRGFDSRRRYRFSARHCSFWVVRGQRSVAQLAELRTHNAAVAGSSPAGATRRPPLGRRIEEGTRPAPHPALKAGGSSPSGDRHLYLPPRTQYSPPACRDLQRRVTAAVRPSFIAVQGRRTPTMVPHEQGWGHVGIADRPRPHRRYCEAANSRTHRCDAAAIARRVGGQAWRATTASHQCREWPHPSGWNVELPSRVLDLERQAGGGGSADPLARSRQGVRWFRRGVEFVGLDRLGSAWQPAQAICAGAHARRVSLRYSPRHSRWGQYELDIAILSLRGAGAWRGATRQDHQGRAPVPSDSTPGLSCGSTAACSLAAGRCRADRSAPVWADARSRSVWNCPRRVGNRCRREREQPLCATTVDEQRLATDMS